MKMKQRRTLERLFLAALLVFTAAGALAFAMQGQEPSSAVCVLNPTAGNQAHGVVTFTKQAGGIKIVADLEGMTPGEHGFHVHEFGDCSAPDGISAGGHYNPDKKAHGGPMDMERHVGDLGKVTAGADGKAHYELMDTMVAFNGPHSIIGRGVILHAQPDDFKTQPTGNAGARIACGVIGIGK
jgi:superoxide dismutase, Cu-Zn family